MPGARHRLVPFSPLGRRFLTGRYSPVEGLAETDLRRGQPRFGDGNLARNLAIVAKLNELAAAKDLAAIEAAAPPEQVADTRYDATSLTFVNG
ncbi:hypothetical protein [Nonomuraea sp. NPDC049141]|uniref:hypothetical protein n=1 Tax=Nonomuraea sp. NPDC049141 TaxID=3155500 RepID=UPI0033FCC623